MSPRILIVRFSAVGDCVMAAWPVTAIRQRHPEALIVWACESRCAPVIDQERLVSELALFPRELWKARKWSPTIWMQQLRTYTGLRKWRFDLGIDFQGHSKTALCLRLAAPKKRFAARATDAFARRLNQVDFQWDYTRHEIEESMRFLNTIEPFPTPERPTMPNVDAERARIVREVGTGTLVTIQTGAGGDDKRYPIEHWQAVAEELKGNGFTVAAMGAPSDPHLNSADVIDWVGQLSWREAMAAIKGSDVHLAGDTGTGHIAAALGVPVVSVFGPTAPERFRPYSQHAAVLRSGTSTANVAPEVIVQSAIDLTRSHEPAISD